MNGHFVQTRNRYGLQADTAARCCALFKAQQQKSEGSDEASSAPTTLSTAAEIYGGGATRQ
jgi:hypothetical protein